MQVQTGDGKYVRVHTEKFQDMMQSVLCLQALAAARIHIQNELVCILISIPSCSNL